MDRMTHSVDTIQSLCPTTPFFTQWAHENFGHGGRVGAYTWAQQYGSMLTKFNLVITTAE